jgi:hypothetical protein
LERISDFLTQAPNPWFRAYGCVYGRRCRYRLASLGRTQQARRRARSHSRRIQTHRFFHHSSIRPVHDYGRFCARCDVSSAKISYGTIDDSLHGTRWVLMTTPASTADYKGDLPRAWSRAYEQRSIVLAQLLRLSIPGAHYAIFGVASTWG